MAYVVKKRLVRARHKDSTLQHKQHVAFRQGETIDESVLADGELDRLLADEGIAEVSDDDPASEPAGPTEGDLVATQAARHFGGGLGPGSSVSDLRRLPIDELRKVAAAFGVEYDDKTTKTKLAEAVSKSGADPGRAPQTAPTDAAADAKGAPEGDPATSDDDPEDAGATGGDSDSD